ncbi:tachykinin-like peptides receptor 99D [Biomphalaria pfeifferi]|uniref:Tachykinin-like peptides receptor 99D n=1 Tax=Biomphalaria pfeifferi TaxID=112525 RepID=A0AAD8BD73_BIOPF|nr:tachykinin-like peptides receptor 99D [Biomphalaria pfeifferi]
MVGQVRALNSSVLLVISMVSVDENGHVACTTNYNFTPTTPINVSNVQYEMKRSRYLVYRTAQIILCLLGLMGNGGVILAWSASRRRTPIVALMTSLAVWDLGLLTSFTYYCLRNFKWWYLRENLSLYPWSGSLYQMGYDAPMYLAILAFHSFVCTSVFTVLAISIVRYIAVVRPLVVRRICSKRRIKTLILTIMTCALLVSFVFCLKFLCLSLTSIVCSTFCVYVQQNERGFSYPGFITIGMLPWVGTIPLSALLVVQVTRIPRTRTIRRGSCPASMEYGTRRVTLYVIVMVILSTITYPVSMNIFLAMQESPDWPQSTKEALYLASDFLFIINSIAHIFLFYAGGTYFRSLMYARMTYICACVCQCSDILRHDEVRPEDDIIVVDDVRNNVSSTRDALNSERLLSGNGLEITSV